MSRAGRGMMVVLLVLLLTFNFTWGVPQTLFIGGLFDSSSPQHQAAFMHAIDQINQERTLWPNRLVGLAEPVVANDEFHTQNVACNLLPVGIVALVGPTTGRSADHLQSMCDTMEIPHIEARWDVTHKRESILVNIHPYPDVLSRLYVDMVQNWGWKSFTILYEDEAGLSRVAGLLKCQDHKEIHVRIRQLDEKGNGNYRPVLTQAKYAGETHFVVDCTARSIEEVLRQAQQVGIMSDRHHYILTNPDMHIVNLEPFQWGGSNITGVRMLDPMDDNVTRIARELGAVIDGKFRLELDTALVHDGIKVLSNGLRHLDHLAKAKSMNCSFIDSWEHGLSLVTYMRTSTVHGLTGNIRFDYEGFRSDFVVDIIELTSKGINKVATWNSSEGFNISRPSLPKLDGEGATLHNKSFVVLISLTDPYGMLKDSAQRLTGNDRFEGFGIDLIHQLSLMLGFNYTFHVQEDSVYGSLDRKTGKWTGMIRELMEHRADLAVTDFTVTSERESAIDFTMPFMNLGISILYRKPMKMPPKLFSFTSPFSIRVWYYLGGAYFFVSIMLFVMGRICPDEWQNPYACIEEPEYLYNQLSLRNCFWFTVGSLMQQGSEIAPISVSTRMVAGMWWFFTLIMVSSYTANLAAFLTVESVHTPIKNIEDLANQKQIAYGAKQGGATANFFRDSNYSVYQKIWKYMETHPKSMTSDNSIGVKRANEENYAFLMESTGIEYTIERYCNLDQVGSLLDNKGYGIAMRKNSSYRNILSAAVVKLQETGVLAKLKNKWWKEKKGGGACHADKGSDSAEELTLQNVGGVFVVLFGGAVAGLIVAVGELLSGVLERSQIYKVTFKEELIKELKFLVTFKGQTKPNTCKTMSRVPSNQSLHEKNHYQPAPYGFVVPEVIKNSN